MMAPDDIRRIARQQRARQVALVEFDDGQHRVRVRIDEAGGGVSVPPQRPEAAPRGDEGPVVVASDGLGVFRRVHPSRPDDPAVVAGDRVADGEPLALLQVGDAYTSVPSPCDGIVESVLAEEGQRVDYGMPLFRLRRVKGRAA